MGKTFREGHEFPASFGFTGSAKGASVSVRPHTRAPRKMPKGNPTELERRQVEKYLPKVLKGNPTESERRAVESLVPNLRKGGQARSSSKQTVIPASKAVRESGSAGKKLLPGYAEGGSLDEVNSNIKRQLAPVDDKGGSVYGAGGYKQTDSGIMSQPTREVDTYSRGSVPMTGQALGQIAGNMQSVMGPGVIMGALASLGELAAGVPPGTFGGLGAPIVGYQGPTTLGKPAVASGALTAQQQQVKDRATLTDAAVRNSQPALGHGDIFGGNDGRSSNDGGPGQGNPGRASHADRAGFKRGGNVPRYEQGGGVDTHQGQAPMVQPPVKSVLNDVRDRPMPPMPPMPMEPRPGMPPMPPQPRPEMGLGNPNGRPDMLPDRPGRPDQQGPMGPGGRFGNPMMLNRLKHRFGIDPSNLSPDQRQQLMAAVPGFREGRAGYTGEPGGYAESYWGPVLQQVMGPNYQMPSRPQQPIPQPAPTQPGPATQRFGANNPDLQRRFEERPQPTQPMRRGGRPAIGR